MREQVIKESNFDVNELLNRRRLLQSKIECETVDYLLLDLQNVRDWEDLTKYIIQENYRKTDDLLNWNKKHSHCETIKNFALSLINDNNIEQLELVRINLIK